MDYPPQLKPLYLISIMKKHTILYLLLVVLILMNGFFLYNYLVRPEQKGPREAGNFIAKELNFNENQLQQFNALEEKHFEAMRFISEDVKSLKDELFLKITASDINETTVDSLIALISEKEQLKEKELFNHLRAMYELCDEQQKECFSLIIKKARRVDNQGPKGPKGPPRPE